MELSEEEFDKCEKRACASIIFWVMVMTGGLGFLMLLGLTWLSNMVH